MDCKKWSKGKECVTEVVHSVFSWRGAQLWCVG